MPETNIANFTKYTKSPKFLKKTTSNVRNAKNKFMEYKKDCTLFICQFCLDNCCLQCNKHVYYGQKGILYSVFD